MRLLRVIGLWLVAIALGAVYLSEARRPRTPTPAAAATRERLLDVDEAEVRAVVLVDGSMALRIAQRDGAWAIVEPPETAVPFDLVRAFVESLFATVILEGAVPLEQDPDGFDLDERRRIEIDVADGSRRVLVVGGQTPTGTSAYIRDPAGAVRIIGRNVLVYRELVLDAVRPPPAAVGLGPVAQRH